MSPQLYIGVCVIYKTAQYMCFFCTKVTDDGFKTITIINSKGKKSAMIFFLSGMIFPTF